MSFRLKTIIGIAMIELTVMAILIAINQFALGGTATTQLYQRTEATARVFANAVSDAVIATDLATLDATIESAVSSADLTYIRVRNASGAVLSQGGTSGVLARDFAQDMSFEAATSDGVIDLSVPISVAGSTFGTVEIGMSTQVVEDEVKQALIVNVVVVIVGMSLVAVFGFALGTVLTRQLKVLREGARRISGGDLDTRVRVRGRDELAVTAECFNHMAKSLAKDRANLKDKQEELLDKKARVDAMVERMTKISRGEPEVSIPYTDRADEIGNMARATEIFNKSMSAVRQSKLEQQRLITAFDQVADQVAIFESNGKALFLNATFKAFNESIISALPEAFTLEEFLKEGVRQSAFPEAAQDPERWIAAHIDRTDSVPVEIKRAPDRILLTIQSVVEGIGVVLTAKDVTELRRSEAQLMQASKLATLGEMATGIAHELNQPLGVIRMASSNSIKRIDKGATDVGFYRGKFERISEQTERAAQIIDHMRVFGRKADGNKQPFDLRASLLQMASFARTQFRTQDIALSVNVPDGEAIVMGEPVIFEQVLLNLFSNARDAILDHNPKGGEISVTGMFDRADYYVIEVRDTGGGIPEDILDKLFEPFFTTKEPGKGTGLGLSISFGTIREMDGSIEVRNSDEGACFTISLPVAGDVLAEAV